MWENVCSYIESSGEADVLLQRAGVNDIITADSAFIQNSRVFVITDVSENSGSPNGKYDMCFSLIRTCVTFEFVKKQKSRGWRMNEVEIL